MTWRCQVNLLFQSNCPIVVVFFFFFRFPLIGWHGYEKLYRCLYNTFLFISFLFCSDLFFNQFIYLKLKSHFTMDVLALNIRGSEQNRGDAASSISVSTNADNRKEGNSSKKSKKKKSKNRKRHSSSSSSSESSESSDSSSAESSSSSDSSSSSGKLHTNHFQFLSHVLSRSDTRNYS